MGIIFDNIENMLIHKSTGITHAVIRRFGHAFLMLQQNKVQIQNNNIIEKHFKYLTEGDLNRLHRRFGHPSVACLHKILQEAGHNDPDNFKTLTNISAHCKHCQLNGPAPFRFKFKLKDDKNFNHTILVDIMYLEGNVLTLHVIDEATRYQAARFLKDVSSQSIWQALRLCWIDVYVGPPDLIIHEAGTNFTAKDFQQNAVSLAIRTKCVPVEAAHSIGLVERYHGPLRRAYSIISSELDTIEKSLKLQMAVKAINDTAGPNGLVPTLLV
ncbi:hypothetical protein EV44_g3904 [Erysiphe necator]|uniref:Integrase catalytic domain-containing protein n=1 Tax=Uncinula necator TaxID=52586 RepID=A0A0B1P182_UNCNE|nr:hypothetical protein EV44_g3904 [Erysiphe necator]